MQPRKAIRALATLAMPIFLIACVSVVPAATASAAQKHSGKVHKVHGRAGLSHNRAITHRRSGKRHAVRQHLGAKQTKSRAGLPFDGRRIGDFWVNHSAPGAINEVPNPTGGSEDVFEMTVGDHDELQYSGSPRAELLSPPVISAGDEFWLSTKFLIPTDFPSVPGWMSLVSVYGEPFAGASPWRIGITDNKLGWQRNDTYNYDVPWEIPIPKGRWVNITLHERFGSDGWVEMWVNGTPITFFSGGSYNPGKVSPTTRLSMQTMDSSNDGGVNSAKIMQYRQSGMFESASLYFGSLQLGTSRAQVAS